jgi:hypothetical protein
MTAPTCISSYLREYGSELGERVLSRFPPLHRPSDPAWPALKQLKRRPFPAQQLAIMGITKRWEQARCAAAVAECGTGKTLISLGSVFTHARGKAFTALAMVPPQLILKWAREVFQTLPGVRLFVIDGCVNVARHVNSDDAWKHIDLQVADVSVQDRTDHCLGHAERTLRFQHGNTHLNGRLRAIRSSNSQLGRSARSEQDGIGRLN